jgi:hypothetical protein|tara:strand:+ start:1550 stop:2053 length:504 start_codon:yes stop_codon:yes gene_type:complete
MGIVPEERSIEVMMREARQKHGTPIQDQIEDAIADSKKTGKAVKLRFRKEDMEKEDIFQQLLNDPKTTNFSKDVVFLDVNPLTEITVDELCDICLKAGIDNPIAMEQVKVLQHNGVPFPGEQSVAIPTDRLNQLVEAGKNRGHTGTATSVPTPKKPVVKPKPEKDKE